MRSQNTLDDSSRTRRPFGPTEFQIEPLAPLGPGRRLSMPKLVLRWRLTLPSDSESA